MTETLNYTVADALACHRAGRLEEAERIYGSVLEREPENPDAWHLMGRLALQQGDGRSAAARVLQALRYRPSTPAFHTSLGEILASQNRGPEAVACYREALQLNAGYVPALVALGNALQSEKRYREACTCYWRAIRERPECAEAFCNLGNALRAQGEHAEALTCYQEAFGLQPESPVHAVNLAAVLTQLQRPQEAEEFARRAVRLQPTLAEALSNLSVALAAQRRFGEAEPFARRAVECAPGDAHLHLNLGSLLLEQSRVAEAEQELRRALQIQAEYPQALNNLAVALHLQDREDEAAVWCEKLLQTAPQYAEAWANLGIVRQAQGRNLDAIRCFDQALQRRPDDFKSHVCRALSLLAEGHFAQGFEEYEWRWNLVPSQPRARTLPPWDGTPLNGQTVLLWAEQGLGDTLQFGRFAAAVAARGARVVVEVPDCLASLASSLEGVAEVVTPAAELPPCDVQAPLMSLPRLLGTTVESIPNAVPYLRADPARVAEYRARLGPARNLRAGLVWAGSPLHTSDRQRSIALKKLESLRTVPGIEWHSLQVEEYARLEAVHHGGWLDSELLRPAHADSLAAAMCCLDLVLTVDSMPAHLAGALGLPVWTLLAHVPDWRWQLAGETSPWYPTMRLFRQRKAGDWEEVLARVCGELRMLAATFAAGGR